MVHSLLNGQDGEDLGVQVCLPHVLREDVSMEYNSLNNEVMDHRDGSMDGPRKDYQQLDHHGVPSNGEGTNPRELGSRVLA